MTIASTSTSILELQVKELNDAFWTAARTGALIPKATTDRLHELEMELVRRRVPARVGVGAPVDPRITQAQEEAARRLAEPHAGPTRRARWEAKVREWFVARVRRYGLTELAAAELWTDLTRKE